MQLILLHLLFQHVLCGKPGRPNTVAKIIDPHVPLTFKAPSLRPLNGYNGLVQIRNEHKTYSNASLISGTVVVPEVQPGMCQ